MALSLWTALVATRRTELKITIVKREHPWLHNPRLDETKADNSDNVIIFRVKWIKHSAGCSSCLTTQHFGGESHINYHVIVNILTLFWFYIKYYKRVVLSYVRLINNTSLFFKTDLLHTNELLYSKTHACGLLVYLCW